MPVSLKPKGGGLRQEKPTSRGLKSLGFRISVKLEAHSPSPEASPDEGHRRAILTLHLQETKRLQEPK